MQASGSYDASVISAPFPDSVVMVNDGTLEGSWLQKAKIQIYNTSSDTESLADHIPSNATVTVGNNEVPRNEPGTLLSGRKITISSKTRTTLSTGELEIKVPNLVPGERLPVPVLNADGAFIKQFSWYDADSGSLLSDSTLVRHSRKYKLHVTLECITGYTFGRYVPLFNGLTGYVISGIGNQITSSKEFTVPAAFLLGDVDGNGAVNMKDLAELQRYVNGWNNTINITNADLTGDNNINMKDVAKLQKLINSK